MDTTQLLADTANAAATTPRPPIAAPENASAADTINIHVDNAAPKLHTSNRELSGFAVNSEGAIEARSSFDLAEERLASYLGTYLKAAHRDDLTRGLNLSLRNVRASLPDASDALVLHLSGPNINGNYRKESELVEQALRAHPLISSLLSQNHRATIFYANENDGDNVLRVLIDNLSEAQYDTLVNALASQKHVQPPIQTPPVHHPILKDATITAASEAIAPQLAVAADTAKPPVHTPPQPQDGVQNDVTDGTIYEKPKTNPLTEGTIQGSGPNQGGKTANDAPLAAEQANSQPDMAESAATRVQAPMAKIDVPAHADGKLLTQNELAHAAVAHVN